MWALGWLMHDIVVGKAFSLSDAEEPTEEIVVLSLLRKLGDIPSTELGDIPSTVLMTFRWQLPAFAKANSGAGRGRPALRHGAMPSEVFAGVLSTGPMDRLCAERALAVLDACVA